MKIVIKTKNIKLTKALKDFVGRKVNQLENFSKIFQSKKYFNGFYGKGKPRVEAWVEIGKTTRHHQKGLYYYAECQMRLPGKSLRSEVHSNDLRLAITQVKDELQLQLKQYKNKIAAKTKRNQLELKKSFHLASAAQFKIRKGQRIREEGI